MNPHKGTIKINPRVKADKQTNAHPDNQTLSPTEIFPVNYAFLLALYPGLALQDSVMTSSIKLLWCSYCNNFLRKLFTVSQCPSLWRLKGQVFSGFSARNNCASPRQQVSFFFIGTGEHICSNVLFPLTASEFKSQVCSWLQASLDAFMAFLNSSHMLFFFFLLLSFSPTAICFFTSIYLNIWKLP